MIPTAEGGRFAYPSHIGTPNAGQEMSKNTTGDLKNCHHLLVYRGTARFEMRLHQDHETAVRRRTGKRRAELAILRRGSVVRILPRWLNPEAVQC